MYMIYGELGRYPIAVNVQARMISFWNRLIIGKDHKLSYQLYNYVLNQTNYEFKWISKIKSILNGVGRPDLWQNQHNIIEKYIHRSVKQTLIDQFRQTWHSQIQLSNKGIIYSNFKESPDFENYLKLLPMRDCITLFKYRTANHRLPIETGRWDGTLLQERKCNLCTRNEIGSERHYLLNCDRFQNERRTLFRQINFHENTVSDYGFKLLLTSTSVRTLSKVCGFIRLILKNF